MNKSLPETINFIPERINKRPSVYRGMTLSELMLVILFGCVLGFFIGIMVMILFGNWVWIPTMMLPVTILCVRLSGAYISRLKRGKPENWLERYIELKTNPSQFITHNQFWLIKRLNSK